ncbi:MAG: hypothetical protein BWY87_01468 [Deltaproteobacteria bacterium ADurb.Bin510]|nr:MAG: hypothetical protein BWY87_01468 [Deltaproteobacteria bacterium ADurb.Bin510]
MGAVLERTLLELEAQPQGAVQAEQQAEEQAAQQSVEAQQVQQVAVEDALAVDRDALEDIGEGHAQQKARQETGHTEDPVPQTAPLGLKHLVTKLQRYSPKDQREEHQHQRGVEGAEHDGVGARKGREGHAAGRDQPDLVAVPEGRDGPVELLFIVLGLGNEGLQAAQAEIEAVQHEVDRPEQAPQKKPDVCQHSILLRTRGPCGPYGP